MSSTVEFLSKSSKDYAHKEAVVSNRDRYTYLDINEASDKLAGFLASKGVENGDRVGIFSSKCAEEIVAIFAILKVGGIFVHINPHFVENQLSHVINDCNIKVLFLGNGKEGILERTFIEKNPVEIMVSLASNASINMGNFKDVYLLTDIYKEPGIKKLALNSSNDRDTASIIYTSGSTGMPKGVIITHKILYDSTVASTSVFMNNTNDRLISVTPLSFDGALNQLFSAFYVGGTLVLQESNFPKDIVRTLLLEKISGFHAVPSLWIMLMMKYSSFPNNSYPQLKYISIIGERFPDNYLKKLKIILSKTKLYMMYGTTEAFRSTYLSPDEIESKPGSVGKPFPGVKITIIDKKGKACKSGEVGEIVHEGAFLSPGYFNNSENKNTFKGDRLYTGDLGKLDSDGYLYFISRKDDMIKTMGYRVSPDEIEECLYKIDGVMEAAAIGVPDNEGTKIKVIVTLKKMVDLSKTEVINHCKGLLPYYMVPRIVEFRNELPKTATNKINKSVLC